MRIWRRANASQKGRTAWRRGKKGKGEVPKPEKTSAHKKRFSFVAVFLPYLLLYSYEQVSIAGVTYHVETT